jgi:hypothetical protein
MVDSLLASQAQRASGVGKAEHANVRAPVGAGRSAEAGGQRVFGERVAVNNVIPLPAAKDKVKVGNGLLSTSVQILLAETRSQEAVAPFVAPSKLGQAINTYIETQGQVRDTIRANTGRLPTSGLAVPADTSAASQTSALSAATPQAASLSLRPAIDSSFDDEI